MKNIKCIIAIVLIAAFALTSVGCKKKTPATVDTFYEKTAEYGLQKTDLSLDGTDLASVVKEKAFAFKENGEMLILCEFYIANSKSDASRIFSGTKDAAESFVSGARSSSSVDSGSYHYYRLANSEVVAVLVQVEDTILYIRADKVFESDADGIVKALGYK